MSESSIPEGGDSRDTLSLEDSAIVERLLTDGPARVVLIGAPVRQIVEALSSQCECQQYDTIELCAAASTDDRDAAVALLCFGAGEPDGDSALGMTCRLFPRRVLVRMPGKQPVMPASRFYAFGFHRVTLPGVASSTEGAIVYEYCLADYKRPPDWLNARYWANPQRFGVLEPEYNDSGKPLSEESHDDDYEPEEDEYE